MKRKSKYAQTFIVDRSTWNNSHTFVRSNPYLYSESRAGEERLCCLGFVCHQLGIPVKDFKYKGFPSDLKNEWDIPYLLKGSIYKGKKYWSNSDLTNKAVKINDSLAVPFKEKEKMLKELFNKHKLDIKFVGKYPEGSKI